MRKEKTEHSARLPFAASMLIFGTIGLLRRFIDLPSGVIACFRGLLGCVLLLLLQRLGGKKPGLAAIWKSQGLGPLSDIPQHIAHPTQKLAQ